MCDDHNMIFTTGTASVAWALALVEASKAIAFTRAGLPNRPNRIEGGLRFSKSVGNGSRQTGYTCTKRCQGRNINRMNSLPRVQSLPAAFMRARLSARPARREGSVRVPTPAGSSMQASSSVSLQLMLGATAARTAGRSVLCRVFCRLWCRVKTACNPAKRVDSEAKHSENLH